MLYLVNFFYARAILPVSLFFYLSGKTCSNAPSDCESEFNNAKTNGNLQHFYQRCNQRGDANSFGNRCELCCNGQNHGTPQYVNTVYIS